MFLTPTFHEVLAEFPFDLQTAGTPGSQQQPQVEISFLISRHDCSTAGYFTSGLTTRECVQRFDLPEYHQ